MRANKNSMTEKLAFLLLLIVEGAGLAVFVLNRIIEDFFCRIGSGEILYLGIGIAAVPVFSFLWAGILWVYSHSRFGASLTEPDRVFSSAITASSPLILLNLEVISCWVLLNDYRPVLWAAVGIGVLLLHGVRFFSERLAGRSVDEGIPGQDNREGSRIPAVFLFIVFFVVYGIASSNLIFPRQEFTGDEPHYLVITHSLVMDGDINLADEFAGREYLDFYPGELESHAQPGKGGPSFQYSRHGFLLPLILSPAYFAARMIAGNWEENAERQAARREFLIFAARLMMCLLSAALVAFLFSMIRKAAARTHLAWITALIFGFSPPMIYYSGLIYTEIPAALLSIAVLRLVMFKRNIRPLYYFLVGLGVTIPVWLGIKYLIISLILAAAVLWRIWRDRGEGRSYAAFLVPAAVSAAAYLFFLWGMYGTLLPFSIYEVTMVRPARTLAQFYHFHPVEFFRCGLGYLFDQRVGIIAYAPIFVLFVPGMILAVRRWRRSVAWPMALFWGFFTFCSVSYYWAGYCPPGRTLLPVVWVMAFFAAVSLEWGRGIAARSVQGILAIGGFLFSWILLKNPALLYHQHMAYYTDPQGRSSHLLDYLSSAFVNFKEAVPQLVDPDRILWPALFAWLGAAALITLLIIRSRESRVPVGRRVMIYAVLVAIGGLLAAGHSFFHVRMDGDRSMAVDGGRLYFQNSLHFGEEGGGFWTRGRGKMRGMLRSSRPADEIRVTLSAPVAGDATLQVGARKIVLKRNGRMGKTQTVVMKNPVGYRWRGGWLYILAVRSETSFRPARIEPGSTDGRSLGVHVTAAVR